jgi:two-component system sensor histidine kinase/response regulator
LLGEDDEFSARYMERLLTGAGHVMTWVQNGRDALRLALEQHFALLLLNVHMPELDGFQVIRVLREHERESDNRLRVIALTARSRKEDRQKCFDAGMDDFVTKPVAASELFSVIERNITQQDSVSQQDSPLSSTNARGDLNLLDPQAILGACGNDREGLERILADFQTYTPLQLSNLQEAYNAGDSIGLQKSAHKFYPLLYAFSSQAGVSSRITKTNRLTTISISAGYYFYNWTN